MAPMTDPNSRTWTWVDGDWHEGNPGLIGPRSHAFWLGSSVFDGARAFEGVAPDLDLHCARANASARALELEPTMPAERIVELAEEGIARFETEGGDRPELYIRPMYWAEAGGPSTVMPDETTTRFCLCLYDVPMPSPDRGISVTLSPYRRPAPDSAPTQAKAGCLYPNPARALREAKGRGFDNAVMRDPIGNVAELATANVFLGAGGAVHTPAPNGTFLDGITRQRVIGLLRGAGVTVHERSIAYDEMREADELFSTGNYSKVMPVNRIEDRVLQPGPFGRQARELYWAFAHGRLA